LNVTVPVAVEGVTVAVNVTALPKVDGFNEDVSATEEFDFPYAIPVRAMQDRTTRMNADRSSSFDAEGRIVSSPAWS
jgi:hypothetical protein